MERSHPLLGRIARIVLAFAIVTGGFPHLWDATPAAAAGAITGTVFQDYNDNGIKDTGSYAYGGTAASAIDSGVTSVTITAYDTSGAAVGTTTTAANGTYTQGARITFVLLLGQFPRA